ncbi:hypothetical protein [Thermococcus sp. JCM 11816]|uniref:hypothetical protein n=1 Tax=Thermococcus sp. (strain JCM 11816 / KS-1) TaxID=1295125 RepID=UPI003465674A
MRFLSGVSQFHLKFPRSRIYDRKIEEIPFEDAHALALQYAEKMRELKEKETLSGSISLAFERYGVVNSNGVELEASSTYMGGVSAYAVREDTPGNGSFYQDYRSLQGIEALEEAIMKAKEDAELSAGGAKRLELRGRSSAGARGRHVHCGSPP